MKDDGFDVVIGNPPYVKARDSKDMTTRRFVEESGEYETPYKMWDLYVAFVERGIKLLKPDGVFAMIVPDTIGVADYTKKLVGFIINKYSLYQIDFFPNIEVFTGVGVRSTIIFVKNTKNSKKCKRFLHEAKVENIKLLDTVENNTTNIFKLNSSKIESNFENTIPLGNICYVSYGARFNSDKVDPIKFKKADLLSDIKDSIHTHRYTEGKYLEKYKIVKELFVEWGTDRCPKRLVRPTFKELYPPEKLLMSRQKRITALSTNGEICDNTIIVGVPYFSIKNVKNASIEKYLKNVRLDRNEAEKTSLKFDLKYLLAILNSKLIRYLLKTQSRSKIDSYPDDWKLVPIKDITKADQKKFIELTEEILSLNKHLNQIPKNVKVSDEIKRYEEEIDELVYKLYNLTEEEKRVIEEDLA